MTKLMLAATVATLLCMVQSAWAEATTSWTMDYTGDIQTFTAPCSGIYELKVWGAQGGQFIKAGGLGGYATCRTTLTQGETIYIYVGGKGGDGYVSSTGGAGGVERRRRWRKRGRWIQWQCGRWRCDAYLQSEQSGDRRW